MIVELQRVRDTVGEAFLAGAPLERVLEEVRLASVDAGLTEGAAALEHFISHGCEAHELVMCRVCRMHLKPTGEPARL